MTVFLTNSGDVADLAGNVGIILNFIKLYTENSWLNKWALFASWITVSPYTSLFCRRDDTNMYLFCQVLTEAALLSF